MVDNFDYTTQNISHHAPTFGLERWQSGSSDGNISTDGKQALVSVANGTVGNGSIAANYPFIPSANTIYTLKVITKIAGTAQCDAWAGIGFSYSSVNSRNDRVWMLISVSAQRSSVCRVTGMCGPVGNRQDFGHELLPASAYSAPITAVMKWNTGSGEARFFINGHLQEACTGKAALPTGECSVFFKGWQTGDLFSVTNVTLSAEPVNATQP